MGIEMGVPGRLQVAPLPQPLPTRGRGGIGSARLRMMAGDAGGLSAPLTPRGYFGEEEAAC